MAEVNSGLRRNILDQSRIMLTEQGFDQLSMRKIAGAVGCSATSIYLYFNNKDALLHALIEEGFDKLYDHLTRLPQKGKAVLERIESYCRAFIGFGLDNAEYYEIMFQIHPKHMQRYPVEKFRKARKNLDLLMFSIEEGHHANLFYIPDTKVAANVVLAMLHGGISLMNAGRVDARIPADTFIDTIIASVVAGLKATRKLEEKANVAS